MAYSDDEYLEASAKLSSAIYTLINNDIPDEDIREMVENALEEGRVV